MDHTCSRHTLKLLVALLLSGLVTGVARAQAPAASPTPTASPTPPAGPTVGAPMPADKVVLKIGDQQYTKADMDFLVESLPPQAQQSLATQGKKPLGDQFAFIVMLSQQAHLHHLDEGPDFARKLALQKQQIEAQAALQEINDRAKVTPEEINQYYTAHATDYDEITMRQVIVRKKAASPQGGSEHATAPSGPGLTPEDAKARAEAIHKELVSGTDIKKVMADFVSPGNIVFDSEPRKIRRGSMRPDMEKVAFGLKDGEFSDPIDVPQAVIIFQVTGHNHVDIKDVTPDIEKTLKQQKVDAALAEIKKSNTLWMDEQYFAPPLKLTEGPTLGTPTVKTPPKP